MVKWFVALPCEAWHKFRKRSGRLTRARPEIQNLTLPCPGITQCNMLDARWAGNAQRSLSGSARCNAKRCTGEGCCPRHCCQQPKNGGFHPATITSPWPYQDSVQ